MAYIEIVYDGVIFETSVFTVPTYNKKMDKTYVKYRTSIPYPVYDYLLRSGDIFESTVPKRKNYLYFYEIDSNFYRVGTVQPDYDVLNSFEYSSYFGRPLHLTGAKKGDDTRTGTVPGGRTYTMDIPSKYVRAVGDVSTAVFEVLFNGEDGCGIYFSIR